MPALATTKRVDLVIPWAECEHVVVELGRFDDGLVDAIVITTPARTIAVRADVYEERPAQIVALVAAARAELAAGR